jgi:hypothetical protein
LAAAAYNGGENRVARWQASGGSLPAETQAYVQIVTGVPVDSWSAGEVKAADYTLDPQRGFREACVDLAKGLPLPGPVVPSSPWKPWGVLIAQNISAKVARAGFERVRAQYGRILGDEVPLVLTVHNPAFGRAARHSAMLGRDSRKQADALCAELHKAGAACVVVKN